MSPVLALAARVAFQAKPEPKSAALSYRAKAGRQHFSRTVCWTRSTLPLEAALQARMES